MFLDNLFKPRKSEQELKEETEELGRLVFPLGDGQRAKIEALLKEIDSKKIDQIDLLICFIAGKKQYLKEGSLGFVYRKAMGSNATLTKQQGKEIAALVALDSKAETLEQLPTIEQIRAYAQQLEVEG
ncbi:hypothetical protein [Acetanaerobacterium elongatum]|uniref:Uncharacterized protein n=1 Tax=Acetanaerobacterium elongatum TaxID=258515 RepID=A0A1G9XUD8_9FIRM|nr:hypothetical protein [Acetanaerobacterium elongatum]SDM99853.1 hypothetical protein SAMN05192585_10935 [Acetanaerobacterium elongatum]